ncbi:hypothetical protein KUCAC02_035325 [Chaenocephalus aceratus]|nr:hypothetical protein KUCAC02_035325 [Chaenocephalus aceratus]
MTVSDVGMITKERCVFQAEARLAAKRAARAEARDIRMKELERQQKEMSDDEERMSVGSRGSLRVEDRPDRDLLDKGSRTASTLSAATLASLGGASSRRGSCDTSVSVETEASIRDIKDSLQEEVEERYRKAMVSNAQLHNQKTSMMFQELERQRQAFSVLQFQFREREETLRRSEALLTSRSLPSVCPVLVCVRVTFLSRLCVTFSSCASHVLSPSVCHVLVCVRVTFSSRLCVTFSSVCESRSLPSVCHVLVCVRVTFSPVCVSRSRLCASHVLSRLCVTFSRLCASHVSPVCVSRLSSVVRVTFSPPSVCHVLSRLCASHVFSPVCVHVLVCVKRDLLKEHGVVVSPELPINEETGQEDDVTADSASRLAEEPSHGGKREHAG